MYGNQQRFLRAEFKTKCECLTCCELFQVERLGKIGGRNDDAIAKHIMEKLMAPHIRCLYTAGGMGHPCNDGFVKEKLPDAAYQIIIGMCYCHWTVSIKQTKCDGICPRKF